MYLLNFNSTIHHCIQRSEGGLAYITIDLWIGNWRAQRGAYFLSGSSALTSLLHFQVASYNNHAYLYLFCKLRCS